MSAPAIVGVRRGVPSGVLRRSALGRAGFTLMEVVIALAILGLSLYVLIDTQATAVLETTESRKILTGAYLAQQKMTDALMRLEKEGFTDTDIEESGDFKTFAEDEGLDASTVDFGDSFDQYKWAYAVRKVNIQLGDVSSASDQLQAAGIGPTQEQQDNASTGADGTTNGRDLTDLGIQPDMISDMLAPYIREVRVVVWWSKKEPDPDKACEDCIELVTHVANPSGTVALASGTPS